MRGKPVVGSATSCGSGGSSAIWAANVRSSRCAKRMGSAFPSMRVVVRFYIPIKMSSYSVVVQKLFLYN